MQLSSYDFDQINNVYDVYILGILNTHEDVDPPPTSTRLAKVIANKDSKDEDKKSILLNDVWHVHKTFKIKIGKPWSLVHNTAPTVDFFPPGIKTIQGDTIKFDFAEATDFEDNIVHVEFLELKSKDQSVGGQSYPDWLSFYNSTNFADCSITIEVPEDAEAMNLVLKVIIGDDHTMNPLTTKYEVGIEIEEKVEYEMNFDPLALL